ncbi:uncharacterized protein LOC132928463 [Rhopalosiphum padi]|uniref:uncharacterized protein LOC132928463 n=1 Tax=Rhopalosiphum padi TaxID=40932 RepID=UPI00298EB46E|nr:uncharacterized protein LOC132928463 [Rhopalosiphum padi]XP_060849132.1 uncharacterized protein LOC132928463 [Rhopalosiphum padi]
MSDNSDGNRLSGRGDVYRSSETSAVVDTPSGQQQTTANYKTLTDKSSNDILSEYLLLELGQSKKEIFNYVHLSQSMRITNINNNKKLLNTILHSKVINTQLEVEVVLSCLGVNSCQTPSKPLQAINTKDHKNRNDHKDRDDHKNANDLKHEDDYKDRVDPKDKEMMSSSIGPLILQFTQLEESNFKNQFFVTRSSFQIVCRHLMQEYGSMAYKRTEIDVEKQLLVTLTYLGTVLSYKEIGSKFNIAISTAHKCVNDVTNTLFKRMGELIYWPINQQADSEIKAFNEMPGNHFPDILGVIGMVDLKKTCTANPSKHTKDGSSIAIQCVCNNRYQFYNVFTSYLLKSSVTTSTFLESPLAEMILNDPDTLFPNSWSHIVGQCCFPLLPNLMTPFSGDTCNTISQNTYNNAIEVPLNIIKLAFGKLLGRFTRLLCLDLWGQDKFAILIFAACCLHNLCLGNNDDIHCPPYECCTFKCDYYDEYSVQKRREICSKIKS